MKPVSMLPACVALLAASAAEVAAAIHIRGVTTGAIPVSVTSGMTPVSVSSKAPVSIPSWAPVSVPTATPVSLSSVTSGAMPVSGSWTCTPVQIRTADWYDHDGDGTPSAGDCLAFPHDMAGGANWENAATSTGHIPGTTTLATFSLNKTCGGYTIVEIIAAPDSSVPADPASVPPADLKCPVDTMPVTSMVVKSDGGGSSGGSTKEIVNLPPELATGRGAGVAVHQCPSGYDADAGLCYPSCRDGYSGSGPLCLTNCPSGFRDDGLYCFKPDSYGRGVGTVPVTKTSCKSWSCTTTSTCGSKEDCLGLCYNSCRDGYYASGCNVCSPHCPSGMTDIGVSCQKGSYGRGVGKPMSGGTGEEYQDGLCYPPCPSGKTGSGPLCFHSCPDAQPYRLGDQCYRDKAVRDGVLSAIVIGTVLTVATAGAYAAAGSSYMAMMLSASSEASLSVEGIARGVYMIVYGFSYMTEGGVVVEVPGLSIFGVFRLAGYALVGVAPIG